MAMRSGDSRGMETFFVHLDLPYTLIVIVRGEIMPLQNFFIVDTIVCSSEQRVWNFERLSLVIVDLDDVNC